MREPAHLTRRALAAALPIAALVASPAVAISNHPDAELLQLVASFEAAEAHREECDERINEAFDRLEVPEIPEVLYWRRSDFPGVLTEHPNECLAQYDVGGGRLEHVYERLDDLPSRWTGPQPSPFAFGKLNRQDSERASALIAAINERQAAIQRAEDAAGLTAASEASDRAVEHCGALRRQIIYARAHTPEEMMAKIRAMVLHFPDDPAWVEERLKEAVAKGGGADCARWFGMSLALDAMSLEGRTPPIAKTRSVAA